MADFWIIRNTEQLKQFAKWGADYWDFRRPMKLEPKAYRQSRSMSQNNLFHQWCDDLAKYWTAHSVRLFGEQIPFDKLKVKLSMKRAFANIYEDCLEMSYDPLMKRKVPTLRSTADYDTGLMFNCMTHMQVVASGYGCYLEVKGEFEKLMEEAA